MTTAITLFFALTLALAASILLYALGLRRLARDGFPWPAIVPFASPFYLWRRGERGLPIALATTMIVYALLWISASQIG